MSRSLHLQNFEDKKFITVLKFMQNNLVNVNND